MLLPSARGCAPPWSTPERLSSALPSLTPVLFPFICSPVAIRSALTEADIRSTSVPEWHRESLSTLGVAAILSREVDTGPVSRWASDARAALGDRTSPGDRGASTTQRLWPVSAGGAGVRADGKALRSPPRRGGSHCRRPPPTMPPNAPVGVDVFPIRSTPDRRSRSSPRLRCKPEDVHKSPDRRGRRRRPGFHHREAVPWHTGRAHTSALHPARKAHAPARWHNGRRCAER